MQIENLKQRNMRCNNPHLGNHLNDKLSAMQDAALLHDNGGGDTSATTAMLGQTSPSMNGRRIVISLDEYRDGTSLWESTQYSSSHSFISFRLCVCVCVSVCNMGRKSASVQFVRSSVGLCQSVNVTFQDWFYCLWGGHIGFHCLCAEHAWFHFLGVGR